MGFSRDAVPRQAPLIKSAAVRSASDQELSRFAAGLLTIRIETYKFDDIGVPIDSPSPIGSHSVEQRALPKSN